MANNPLTHTNGQPSGTKRWFSVVALVVTARMAVGGVEIPGVIKFEQIDLMGAAALVTAFGAIYCARRGTDAWRQKNGGGNG